MPRRERAKKVLEAIEKATPEQKAALRAYARYRLVPSQEWQPGEFQEKPRICAFTDLPGPQRKFDLSYSFRYDLSRLVETGQVNLEDYL
jgi:hypothetical protein